MSQGGDNPQKGRPHRAEMELNTLCRHDFDLVMVCPHLGEGGAQRVITNLANAWSARGRRICVVSLFADPPCFTLDTRVPVLNVHRLFLASKIARSSRVSNQSVPMSAKARDRLWALLEYIGVADTLGYYRYFGRLILGLRRVLRCLHTPVIISFVGETNLITLIAAVGLGRRLVISERNDPARERLNRIWNGLRPLLYRRADLVTANCRHALNWMRRYVPDHKLRLIPNPIAIGYASGQAVGISPSEARVILSVGRLHHQKGHDLLLQAFAALPVSLRDWRLVIAGDGEQRAALENLARSLGIANRVSWCGFVDDPRDLYQTAGLFVLASRYEGMSNALLEAMSHGLPAVVTDACPGSLELVRDGETGLVVRANDVAALVEALSCLATSPLLRLRLGRAGRECTRDYELNRVIQQWEDALDL